MIIKNLIITFDLNNLNTQGAGIRSFIIRVRPGGNIPLELNFRLSARAPNPPPPPWSNPLTAPQFNTFSPQVISARVFFLIGRVFA